MSQLSNSFRKSSLQIIAYLIISAQPSAKVSSGRVLKVSGSQMTKDGWWKAPTRFLPAGMFTAVLPPTEESMAARKVVGICTKGMPRR